MARGRDKVTRFAGGLPLRTPSPEEGVVLDAEVAAAIEENLAAANYGRDLAARGVTVVALSADGELVEVRPDGSASPVD